MPLNFVALQIHTLYGRDVCRSRHVLKYRIKQLLYALVPVSRSTAYRYCRTFACSLTQNSLQVFNRRLLALKILHHKIIIKFTYLLNKFCVIQLGLVLHIIRDLDNRNILTLVIIINICKHLKQIYNSLELVFLTDRKLNADRVLTEPVLDLFHRRIEIRTQDIHLVDECHTGYVICIGLTPYVFRLGLNTALSTEYTNRSVKYAK